MAAYTTIDDPSAYFKVQLYTGDGAANHAITFDDTDTDMQPDLVWIKNRDATDSNCLFDAVRGATKLLITDAETQMSTDADTLDSFASDGFQVDADVKVNTDTEKYVAWCWKAGGGAGSANTDGSINTTSTSVNTTSGLSISTYTGNSTSGATIGHGLGAVPQLIIVRATDHANMWPVFHHKNTAAPETDYLVLDDWNATADDASRWNDTAPTSTVFSLGNGGAVNTGHTYVAYAWSEKQGFSKFGGFTGNANADGPFVYTGFRPAFVLVKTTPRNNNWHIFDTKRNPGNQASLALQPNTNVAEYDEGDGIDIFSNGFKVRESADWINGSGETIIYAAFAEAPFVNSSGVPCNAR